MRYDYDSKCYCRDEDDKRKVPYHSIQFCSRNERNLKEIQLELHNGIIRNWLKKPRVIKTYESYDGEVWYLPNTNYQVKSKINQELHSLYLYFNHRYLA